MSELPEGWTETAIRELFTFKYGKGLPQELRQPGEVCVYGSNGVVGKHSESVTSGVTIIIGRKGSVGEVHISPNVCWPIDTTYYIDEFPCELPADYWALYLKSLQLGQQDKSSAIPGISRDDIYALQIPLPPLNEQRRIVAKLETLLGKLDACQQRLAKIPRLLKRFRQSIFDLAITGKITEDWRTQQREQYSATEDLQLFLGRKRNKSRESEPNEGCELLAESIPSSWEAPPLEDLFLFIDYRGKNPVKTQQGKRLITAKNIRMGCLSDTPAEFVSDETYVQWMTRGFPKKGDILFVTEGATMGFVAINSRDDEFALAQRTLTLQPYYPVDTKVFLYFMMSSLFQNLVRINATGSAAVGIKAARFRGFPIAFPPLAEQQEIVRRVEAFFRLADQLEARYHKAKAHVDKLQQSILAKAFRGELVPQDPQDEPAAVLLERIRAERAARQAPTTKSAKRSAKVRK